MAIDSRDKRCSALLVSLPWRVAYPTADGTISGTDRQIVTWLYSGIAAAVAAAEAISTLQVAAAGFRSTLAAAAAGAFGLQQPAHGSWTMARMTKAGVPHR